MAQVIKPGWLMILEYCRIMVGMAIMDSTIIRVACLDLACFGGLLFQQMAQEAHGCCRGSYVGFKSDRLAVKTCMLDDASYKTSTPLLIRRHSDCMNFARPH